MNNAILRAGIAALCTGLITSGCAVQAQGEHPQAQVQPGERSKIVLVDSDYPGNGFKTQIVRVETPAGATAPRHVHPGIESGYIIQGGGTLYIEGREPIEMRPGMTALVPPNTPHWFQNGADDTEIVTTYVVEADKPLTTNLPDVQ